MPPAPEMEGAGLITPPSPSNLKMTSTFVGGSRRMTPKSLRRSPKTVSTKVQSPRTTTTGVDSIGNIKVKQPETSFKDHQVMCSRVAKSLYFANKLPTTPRPSMPLTRLAVSTFTKKARQDTLSFLDMEQAAEIGRNACVTPTALIMSLVYLERLSNNSAYLGNVKPSELFVVSLLVASKFIQDDGEELGIFNDEWATSAHIELKKLNRMELNFLTAIDWKVKVDPDEYGKVLDWLEKEVALGEGVRRGWFTYTEVANLLSFHLLWPTIYQHCVKVITAACVTYATLLATLVTTSMLGPHIFMLSKSCLTTLTTGPSYQPCSNNSTNSFHTEHRQNGPLMTNQQGLDTELTNLDDVEVQLGSQFNFENVTDPSTLDVNFRTQRLKWSRPGLAHDPPQNQHLNSISPYRHNSLHLGLNLESLFTHELHRVFKNHQEQHHAMTDTGIRLNTHFGHCKKRHMPITTWGSINRERCPESDVKLNGRFSSFGLSLPHIKLIRV